MIFQAGSLRASGLDVFRIRRWVPTVGVIIAAAVGAATGGGEAWADEAYVWQRDPNPAVIAAVERGTGLLDGLHLLAAEVSWREDGIQVWRPAQGGGALPASVPKRAGLVLRVGPYGGPFATDDATASRLVGVAAEVLAEARARGVEPAELQIDFDCAESKLGGYRAWLLALRPAMAPTPLVITVLPSWMRARDAFARLLAATDGFVLQVHSLERPSHPDEPFSLCDPARARAWAAQAGTFGVPFRIALPTYGYVLSFNAEGDFVSLAAEQSMRAAPPGGSQRIVMADALAMADLAQELRVQPPPGCTGLIWFRLPVDGDRLNFAWSTFAKVVRGGPLIAKLDLAVQWPEPALAEVVVVNAGDTTEQLDERIALTWPTDAVLVATDGLAGVRVHAPGGRHAAILEPPAAEVNRLITPGERRIVAWFRFLHAAELSVHFTTSP